MRKVLNKIKSIHIVIIILLLILFKLNAIANDLSYIEPSVDLSTIEDKLRQIEDQLSNLR